MGIFDDMLDADNGQTQDQNYDSQSYGQSLASYTSPGQQALPNQQSPLMSYMANQQQAAAQAPAAQAPTNFAAPDAAKFGINGNPNTSGTDYVNRQYTGGFGGRPLVAPQGPGAEGWAKGVIAAHQMNLQDNQDARSQSTQDMTKEQFGWSREDRQKQQALDAGMQQAAKIGGYTGVIDFLRTADPEKAVKFESAKTALDSQIMDNDVMRNITIPQKREEALFQSYGLLGKMGAGLLQAAPNMRQAMYDNMMPLIKTVIPNPPPDVAGFAPIALLAVSQAAPANKVAFNEQKAANLTSPIGKIIEDHQKAVQTYGADSKEAQALAFSLNNNLSAQSDAAYKSKMLQAQMNGTMTHQLNQENLSSNKDFTLYNNANNALSQVKINPTKEESVANDTNLLMNYLTMTYGKQVRFNPNTKQIISGMESIPGEMQSLYSHASTGGLGSPELRKQLIEGANNIFTVRKSQYDASQQRFKQTAVSQGLDPANIVGPVTSTPAPVEAVNSLSRQRDDAIENINNGTDTSGNKVTRTPQQKAAALQSINAIYSSKVKNAQNSMPIDNSAANSNADISGTVPIAQQQQQMQQQAPVAPQLTPSQIQMMKQIQENQKLIDAGNNNLNAGDQQLTNQAVSINSGGE